MDDERRKRKYLDKLKKTSSLSRTITNVGISDIQSNQSDNSLCFNESYRQYYEPNVPNDLLTKVKRYNDANPLFHISKNRLTVIKGLHQNSVFRSNIQNINQQNTVNKSSSIQNVVKSNSFIKLKQTVVNYETDTKIKLGPPNATSTIKYKQIYPLKGKNVVPTISNNKKCVSENIYLSDSVSDCSSSSMIIRGETRRYSIISSDKKLNKNKCININIEDKAKLNLTYCLYLEFVCSYLDEIISINEKVYINNDCSKNLKKRLLEVKFKYQNIQTVNTMSSKSISNCNNCISKPVPSLSYSPDKCTSLFSQDSFVCSLPQSISTCGMSFDSSLDKFIKKLNNNQESNSENSEVSFRYYRRKMF